MNAKRRLREKQFFFRWCIDCVKRINHGNKMFKVIRFSEIPQKRKVRVLILSNRARHTFATVKCVNAVKRMNSHDLGCLITKKDKQSRRADWKQNSFANKRARIEWWPESHKTISRFHVKMFICGISLPPTHQRSGSIAYTFRASTRLINSSLRSRLSSVTCFDLFLGPDRWLKSFIIVKRLSCPICKSDSWLNSYQSSMEIECDCFDQQQQNKLMVSFRKRPITNSRQPN